MAIILIRTLIIFLALILAMRLMGKRQLGELELESPDLPFGLGSGAAVIYGTSGGVAEAVVLSLIHI